MKTNIGVQLLPIIFLLCSVSFYALGANVYAACCFALGLLFGFVLLGETFKKNDDAN